MTCSTRSGVWPVIAPSQTMSRQNRTLNPPQPPRVLERSSRVTMAIKSFARSVRWLPDYFLVGGPMRGQRPPEHTAIGRVSRAPVLKSRTGSSHHESDCDCRSHSAHRSRDERTARRRFATPFVPEACGGVADERPAMSETGRVKVEVG